MGFFFLKSLKFLKFSENFQNFFKNFQKISKIEHWISTQKIEFFSLKKIKLLKSIDDCSPCPEKYYCPLVGMIDDEFKEFICSDGYACDEGATTITGNRQCSKDHYCIKGIAY